MKSSGNGRPEQCAQNLLRISRGEVPYDRLKGLSTASIDKPAKAANASLQTDAEWVLRTYEPRIDINSINVSLETILDSAFSLNADISVKRKEVTNGRT